MSSLIYITIRIRARKIYRLRIEIKSKYSNVFIEISGEETKERYFFDKQFLN